MTKLHHEVSIHAPVDRVWRVLANLEEVQHYNPLVAKTVYTSSNREGVNASRHCDFKPKGFSNERVTDWIPHKLLGMEVVDSSFPMRYTRWKTHVIDQGDKTLVKQELEYEVKFGILGILMNALMMKRKYNAILNDIFLGLKKYIEK